MYGFGTHVIPIAEKIKEILQNTETPWTRVSVIESEIRKRYGKKYWGYEVDDALNYLYLQGQVLRCEYDKTRTNPYYKLSVNA